MTSATVDDVRVGHRRAGRVRGERPDLHLTQADPVPASHPRRIGDDPVQPPVEGRDIAQARELPPCRHERFLRGVGGISVVEEDRPGEAIAAIDATRDERVEGGRVALPGALNERRRRPTPPVRPLPP